MARIRYAAGKRMDKFVLAGRRLRRRWISIRGACKQRTRRDEIVQPF